jgi:hypothetical protein
MAPEPDPRREERPPGSGWELGAGGFSRVGWGVVTALLFALALLLFATGYVGYGGMIVVLGLAAAVNLL